ncbi:RpnC/YadD family protein [Streptomyces spongiae]|uniref:Rpn family recombination-promoting nuclease/putative transposase n=1 Tax=Streptomyces spongiae TaxID=565072 RepID=A0A5N8XUR3_9ACTN|nr:hypothetical protein [Streptomyces spongiae]MPY63114.1 hypothetical protein [Streptomyces spongiae]
MVTSTHEASHRIFQEHPEALAPVFEALGLPPPTKAIVEALTPDATEIRPMERRVDTVLKVEPSDGDGFLLAVEAQTQRAPDKGANWAYYVAYLRAKFDLPVLLVAVCRRRSTATWAAGPFECRVGPWVTQSTRPFVLGPDSVPEITDESMIVREPAMATVAAIVHSESANITAILDILARGMRSFDKATAKYWCEFLEVGLKDTPARETWKGLQKMVATYFPGHGTLFEETYLEGKAEGKAEGEATLILRLLERRGIPVPEDVRERVLGCTDLDTLTLWFDRSLTAATVEELFAQAPETQENGAERP